MPLELVAPGFPLTVSADVLALSTCCPVLAYRLLLLVLLDHLICKIFRSKFFSHALIFLLLFFIRERSCWYEYWKLLSSSLYLDVCSGRFGYVCCMLMLLAYFSAWSASGWVCPCGRSDLPWSWLDLSLDHSGTVFQELWLLVGP